MHYEHRTVAELLGITLDVEPAPYCIGCEPAEPPPPRPARRRAPRLDRTKVAPYYAAARAGVPDADIARAAGVSVAQARGWRMRLRMRRRPGTSTAARIHGMLLATPDLARALRDYDRDGAPEPPSAVHVSYEELEAYLKERGLSIGGDYREPRGPRARPRSS